MSNDFGVLIQVNGNVLKGAKNTGYINTNTLWSSSIDEYDGVAGNNDFLVYFHQNNVIITVNGEIVKRIACGVNGEVNISEKFLNVGKTNIDITISRLDKSKKNKRFVAKWKSFGNEYEVIFGYGIANNVQDWSHNIISSNNSKFLYSLYEKKVINKLLDVDE